MKKQSHIIIRNRVVGKETDLATSAEPNDDVIGAPCLSQNVIGWQVVPQVPSKLTPTTRPSRTKTSQSLLTRGLTFANINYEDVPFRTRQWHDKVWSYSTADTAKGVKTPLPAPTAPTDGIGDLMSPQTVLVFPSVVSSLCQCHRNKSSGRCKAILMLPPRRFCVI